MNASWNITTDPTVEPISVSEAKSYLRLDGTDHDAELEALITAARQYAEEQTGRAFITRTITLKMDNFLYTPLYLPQAPIQSVTSVTYYDTAGTSQTWSSSEYTVDTSSNPGRLQPAFGYSWPDTYDELNAITIVYLAGYGDAATDVPDIYRLLVKMLVSHFFEDRDMATSPPMHLLPLSIRSIISNNRVYEMPR